MTNRTRRRFSARLATPREPILDDAPASLRLGYVKIVLPPYLGETNTPRHFRKEPLDTYETHEIFLARCRIDAEPHDWAESSSWQALTSHLKQCEWSLFFDFVELIAELLIEKDDSIPFDSDVQFSAYRTQVNILLGEENIGWQMDADGELRRKTQAMKSAIVATDTALKKPYAIARQHYKRGLAALFSHPMDEATAIREVISALESAAKVIVPRTKTLGTAVIELRKDPRYNRWGLDIIEKLYTYSNNAAFVRHGQRNGDPPHRTEAEMVFQTSLAMICYLIEMAGTED